MPFLAALVAAFSIGHVYRTMPAALAPPLAADLGLEPWALGVFGGAFSVVFAAMQLPIGVALDRHDLRHVVAALLATALAGTALHALALDLAMLVAAQALIGVGCSGLWLAVCVYVARTRPSAEFAWLTTIAAAIGSSGMFLTTTPLAVIVAVQGWRSAVAVVGALCLALLAMVLVVPAASGTRAAPAADAPGTATLAEMMRIERVGACIALGLVSYGTLLAIRGLWVGPYLERTHALAPIQAGHVAFALSVVMILAPLAFGHADRRGVDRARLIAAGFLTAGAALLLLGLARPGIALATLLLLVFATGASAFVLQYADVRAAAPPGQAGRALSILNLAFLIGVASCQIGAGWVLAAFERFMDPATAHAGVLALLGAVLLAAAIAYAAVIRRAESRPDGR
jgi:predicted MFS family arabinose efflux permease